MFVKTSYLHIYINFYLQLYICSIIYLTFSVRRAIIKKISDPLSIIDFLSFLHFLDTSIFVLSLVYTVFFFTIIQRFDFTWSFQCFIPENREIVSLTRSKISHFALVSFCTNWHHSMWDPSSQRNFTSMRITLYVRFAWRMHMHMYACTHLQASLLIQHFENCYFCECAMKRPRN